MLGHDLAPRRPAKSSAQIAVDEQAPHRRGEGGGVPGATSSPVTSCATIPATPPLAPATTGNPLACASSSAMPKASLTAGHTQRSAAARRRATACGPSAPAQMTRAAERGQRRLDLEASSAVADHLQRPIEIEQARQRVAENAVRGELVAGPHHRRRDQPRRPAGFPPSRPIEAGVEKRLDRDPAPRVGEQRQHAVAVGRVEPDHRIGAPDRLLGGAVAGGPRAARLLWRKRGLGDDIGDAECCGDPRAEPIGRLVVEVVGEPQLRRRSRAPRGSGADIRSASLSPRTASRACRGWSPRPSKLRKRDAEHRLVPGTAQGCEKQLRHPPVARRAPDDRAASAARKRRCACGCAASAPRPARAGRRVHRRLAPDVSPKRRASRSIPAVIENRARTRRSPAAPSAARRAGSPISSARARASAGGSPGGTSSPVAAVSISSGMPGNRRSRCRRGAGSAPPTARWAARRGRRLR